MSSPLIVPIRHHSPAAALQVRRLLAERRPRLVLIEGPADATNLVPMLGDPATEPPIAIYAYHPGAEGHALFYPFCAYSPELVAIQAGLAVGAEVRFCDVPAAVSLGWRRGTTLVNVPTDGHEPDWGLEPEPILDRSASPDSAARGPDYTAFTSALSEAAGTSSFEELWEAGFEQGARDPDAFFALMADFGEKARSLDGPGGAMDDGGLSSMRERVMAAAVREADYSADEIVLVCGAVHVAPIRAFLESPDPPSADFPVADTQPAEIALIPYSFPRLSEQSGYGAGNRAPWFYQQVWEHGNDYGVAVRRALVALAVRLRARGQVASLAQCIDGLNLALTLARLRDKYAPGVDEVLDAAVACFGQGSPGLVQEALREILIGDAVGRVSHKEGRTPLQSDFYVTANRLGVMVLDAPRQVLVHLTVPREAEQSVFFNRLAVADIPFAREIESGLGTRRSKPGDDPLEQLARVREKWEIQWSPATDSALVERTAWGNTLAEVCTHLLQRQLRDAGQLDQSTAILLRLVVCDLLDVLPDALAQCERLAADSASFPSLARAAYHLDGLLTYGAARRLPLAALVDLAQRLFARAVLHLHSAVAVDDRAAAETERALISLFELVRRGSPIADADSFWAAIEPAVELPSCHPSLRGLCLTLAELAGRLAPGVLTARLRFWLSQTSDAADNARLVAGLFAMHRGTLIRNRSLIGAVTAFLAELDIDQLIPLLPVLRRTLGNLSPAERTYLTETLEAVLGLNRVSSTDATLNADDLARVRAAAAEVEAVLATWTEKYDLV